MACTEKGTVLLIPFPQLSVGNPMFPTLPIKAPKWTTLEYPDSCVPSLLLSTIFSTVQCSNLISGIYGQLSKPMDKNAKFR